MRRRVWPAVAAAACTVAVVAALPAPASADEYGGDEELIVVDAHPEVDDVSHVTAGPESTIWFTATDGDRIGRIAADGRVTTFKDPRGLVRFPQGITAAADGNVWFVSFDNDRIGRITPEGEITTFPVHVGHSLLGAITGGPDGNLWFTMRDAIGRMSTDGEIAVFTDRDLQIDVADAITAGPDGNVWFTSFAWRDRRHGALHQIGRVTPAGEVTMFSDWHDAIRDPGGITAGADGNLWFVSRDNNRIGRITPAGGITTYRIPIRRLRGLESITTGVDGNLWFTSTMNSRIGRFTLAGEVDGYSDPHVTLSNDAGITTGADGNLWFAEYYRVSRVTPAGEFTRFPRP